MLIKVPKILYDRGVVRKLAIRTNQSEVNVRRILRFEDRDGKMVQRTLELAINTYKCQPTYHDIIIPDGAPEPETPGVENNSNND